VGWDGDSSRFDLGQREQIFFGKSEIKDSTPNSPTGKSLEPVVLSTPSFRVDLAHDRIKTLARRRSAWIDPLILQRRFAMPVTTGMKDHVYKILELVGSSEKSIEDAIQNALTRASKTIRDMKWFEVVQTRGHIENGSVRHYQVTLRVGFTLEG
jgi:flavin-binding protein dodecin